VVQPVDGRGPLDDWSDVLGELRARPLDAAALEPLFAQSFKDEDEVEPKRLNRSYEFEIARWRPLKCAGELVEPPIRFIDGSMRTRVVALFEDGRGRQRPAVLAVLGAVVMALRLDPDTGKVRLRRHDEILATRLVVIGTGFAPGVLHKLEDRLRSCRIALVAPTSGPLPSDFEAARLKTIELVRREMLSLESELLVRDPGVPTVIDGLLDQRIEAFPCKDIPTVGVVKQQMRSYLHQAGTQLVYQLRAGQRSPAIVLDTTRGEFVSFYLRLADAGDRLPTTGVVRVSVSREFFEGTVGGNFAYLDALGHWLARLRCRDASYPRAAISLEPIVRAEGHLDALLPDIDERVGAFRHATALGLRQRSVA
jgi:hypothetical protein